MTQPCIITVAITGSLPHKEHNLAVPISVAEQIESTHEAFEAGAALVQCTCATTISPHLRDPERFAAFQNGLRRHCPGMIIQFSTGGRGREPAQRGAMLHLKPDMASLELSELQRLMPDATWTAAGIGGTQLEVNCWCLELGAIAALVSKTTYVGTRTVLPPAMPSSSAESRIYATTTGAGQLRPLRHDNSCA